MGYGFAGCAAPRRARGPRDPSVLGQPDPSRRVSRGYARDSRRLGRHADTVSRANTSDINSNGDEHSYGYTLAVRDEHSYGHTFAVRDEHSYGYTFAVRDSHAHTFTHPIADGNANTLTYAFINSDSYGDALAHALTICDGQSYGYCRATIRDTYEITLTDRDSHAHAISDGQPDISAVTVHHSHASAITHVFADGNPHPAAVTNTA